MRLGKYYYHTVTVDVPIGTTAVLATKAITFNKDVEKCTGIKVYPHQASFTVRLGLTLPAGEIHQLTHPDDWRTSTAVADKDRWKEIDFPTGSDLTLRYEPLATLVAGEKFDIVFRCE